MNAPLRHELSDLLLLAAGAVPGALLRWLLEQRALTVGGPWAALLQASLVPNLIGCFLIGLLIVQPPRRASLYLLAGVGFCGSLTTFSSWMLSMAQRLGTGDRLGAMATLMVSLLAGLALVALGAALGRRWLGGTDQRA